MGIWILDSQMLCRLKPACVLRGGEVAQGSVRAVLVVVSLVFADFSSHLLQVTAQVLVETLVA